MLNNKPDCPVGDFDKAWVENTLIWFEQKLGKAFIKRQQFLIPANCNFDYSYFNSHEAIQYFIEFICNYIDLDVSLIEFRLSYEEKDFDFEITKRPEIFTIEEYFIQKYSLNENGKYEIGINESNLNDFDGTFFHLTYKLTYIKLLEEKVFSFENEYMINYAMVLFGFGVLMANIFIKTRQWGNFKYSAWNVKRFGLLSHRIYGYLFALLSNYREDNDANGQKYLCVDVQHFYKKGQKFLEESIDFNNERSIVTDDNVFIQKQFYESGQVRITYFVVNNKYEGLMTFFHLNGDLWSERIYRNGTPFTVLSNYNKYGDIVQKGTLLNGNGTLYIYKPNGDLDFIETYFEGIKTSTTKKPIN